MYFRSQNESLSNALPVRMHLEEADQHAVSKFWKHNDVMLFEVDQFHEGDRPFPDQPSTLVSALVNLSHNRKSASPSQETLNSSCDCALALGPNSLRNSALWIISHCSSEMLAAFPPLITTSKTNLRSFLLFCWQKLFKMVNFELGNVFPTRGFGKL